MFPPIAAAAPLLEEASEEEASEEEAEEWGSEASESTAGSSSPLRDALRSRFVDTDGIISTALRASGAPDERAASRTPSPWELEHMDSQDRFDVVHRHLAKATYRDAVADTRQYFTGALQSELAQLSARESTIDDYVYFELDAIRRVQDSRRVGPTRGGTSPEIFPPDEPGEPEEALPGRALCMLHRRPPALKVAGQPVGGAALPQNDIIEQRCLFELRMPRPAQKPTDIHQFNNVDFKTEFTFNPPGGSSKTAHRYQVTVKGHYDGKKSFFIRFAPHLVGFWTYRTVCNDKKLDGREGRFQCVRAIAQTTAFEKESARVKRFAVGESRIVRPGEPPDDGLHRVMVNMDGSSRDMDYEGWDHMMEFFAFAAETPGTERYTICQAWEPHRVQICQGLPEGWAPLTSFYAYTTRQPGTERFAVGEAFGPHRVMINLDGTGRDMDYGGWTHKLHFFAYPNQKAHVAAIGQAASNLWGLPHLSGILERAFWSWAIYARNSRIVVQGERREAMLRKVEAEIADQQVAVRRMRKKEQEEVDAFQRGDQEWQQAVDDTEDALYNSMRKTSNATGFAHEVRAIRNKSSEFKIAGAQLRSKMDALLAKQQATKVKTDAVLLAKARDGKLAAARREKEFLAKEADIREAQRIADSQRLARLVAQGRGELEQFLASSKEEAEAKAEAEVQAREAAEKAEAAAARQPVPPSGAKRGPGAWQRAKHLVRSGIVSSPAAVQAFREADALRERGDYEQAAESYATALRLKHAATATCHNQRGVCLAEIPERLAEAVEEYTKALDITPHLAAAWHNRGVARMTQGDLAAAVVDLQRALDLSGNEETSTLLAEVTAELASPEQARQEMSAALESYAQGDWSLARTQFERALELGEGRRSRCWNGIGLCHSGEGHLEQSLGAFTRATEEDSGNARAWHNRAKTLAELGRPQEARAARLEAAAADGSPAGSE